MRIGIDIRPLQNGHKYRGIGEVTKQVTNRILQHAITDRHKIVFYEYEGSDPKELLDIPGDLSYETVKLGFSPEEDITTTKGGKLKRAARQLYGDPIPEARQSDVFLQFDYAAGVPTKTRTVLVKHDIIPYLFWDQYFESAWVPFKNKAARTTIRTLFANHRFLRILRRSLNNADIIVSVSNNTKRDIEKHFGVNVQKSKATLLGVDVKPTKTNDISKNVADNLPTKPYLLFVGAGDARRRVEDAVSAFNNLRADGHDMQLVLVGENFKAPEHIPNSVVRNAVQSSSYRKDIITLGYVDDATKQALFKGAVAFVYPTLYEGFGIPILEAMLLECPIITYGNSSTPEVGGKYALYAKDWQGMKRHVEQLLDQSDTDRKRHLSAAKKYAEQFTWDKTTAAIYDELCGVEAS